MWYLFPVFSWVYLTSSCCSFPSSHFKSKVRWNIWLPNKNVPKILISLSAQGLTTSIIDVYMQTFMCVCMCVCMCMCVCTHTLAHACSSATCIGQCLPLLPSTLSSWDRASLNLSYQWIGGPVYIYPQMRSLQELTCLAFYVCDKIWLGFLHLFVST